MAKSIISFGFGFHDANGTRHCFISSKIWMLCSLSTPPKVAQSDPSLKLKTKEGGLVLEKGLEQRRGSRCCAFLAARFEPSLSRPLLTPRCPGWWGFLSKLPSSNHSPLHQPLHYNVSNYLQCNLLYQANIAKLIESSCPSYRWATILLCINHCIVMHPTICNIVNLVNWESPSCCGTNTLLLLFYIYTEYDIINFKTLKAVWYW